MVFSCLLNCLRVSLLGFFSFCLTLYSVHDTFDSVRGCLLSILNLKGGYVDCVQFFL